MVTLFMEPFEFKFAFGTAVLTLWEAVVGLSFRMEIEFRFAFGAPLLTL